MSINFKNRKTRYKLDAVDVNLCMNKLIIFCNMNADSKQANTLKKHLLLLEEALDAGEIK